MAHAAVYELVRLFTTLVVFMIFSCDNVYCYTVKVVTTEDDSKENVEFFKIVDREVPPFSLQEEDDSDVPFLRTESYDMNVAHGVKVSGIFGNVRHKRSLDRLTHECIHLENVSRLVTVDVDDVIHLPCHSCLEDPRNVYRSKQWYKLDMFPSPEGLYHIEELVTDTHDDEHMNRITTSLDHTLVIKDAQLTDSGSYICKKTGEGDSFLNLRLEWGELSDFISKESKLSFYYHVDVLDLEHTAVVDTSDYSSVQTQIPQTNPKLNIEIVTNWYPWSTCTVCDEASTRKRFGLCSVRRMNNNKRVPDKHLEHILKLSADGIPCHSELLEDYPQEMWLSRPNEVQITGCYERCKNTNKRVRRGVQLFMSKVKDQKVNANTRLVDEDDSITKTVKVTIGKYFILKCPDVKLRSTVLWVNGSKLISLDDIIRYNNKGTTIDMFGHIHFKEADMLDSGVYSCWVKGDLKRKYVVEVEEDARTVTKRYTSYLFYSFLGDFVVFVILAIVKRLQRSVQRRRQSKPKSASLADDDSDDDTEESESREANVQADGKIKTNERISDSSDTSGDRSTTSDSD